MGSKKGVEELMEEVCQWLLNMMVWFQLLLWEVLNHWPQELLRHPRGRLTQLFSWFLKHLLLATAGLKVVWPTCTHGRKECPALKKWVPAKSIQGATQAHVSLVLKWQQPFMSRNSLEALTGMLPQTANSEIGSDRIKRKSFKRGRAPMRKGFS